MSVCALYHSENTGELCEDEMQNELRCAEGATNANLPRSCVDHAAGIGERVYGRLKQSECPGTDPDSYFIGPAFRAANGDAAEDDGAFSKNFFMFGMIAALIALAICSLCVCVLGVLLVRSRRNGGSASSSHTSHGNERRGGRHSLASSGVRRGGRSLQASSISRGQSRADVRRGNPLTNKY